MAEIKDYKFFTQLSRAMNGTFGTTGPGTARVSTQDVNLKLLDEELLRANFQMIVNVGNNNMIEQLMLQWHKDGMAMVKATLEKTIENFKELFPDDKQIKFDINENSADDNLEFISLSAYSPTKRAFYRLNVLVNIKQVGKNKSSKDDDSKIQSII